MKSSGPRVLLVDDEPLFCQTLAALLRASGCLVESASSCDVALSHISRDPLFDVLVVDVEMPARSGLELLMEVCQSKTRPLVHVVSAYVTPLDTFTGFVWSKPIDVARLVPTVASGAGAVPDCAFVATVAAISNRSCLFDLTQADGSMGRLWVGQGRILGGWMHTHVVELFGLRAVLALLGSHEAWSARVRMGDIPALRKRDEIDESLRQLLCMLKVHRQG